MGGRLIDANAYAAELWKLRENYQMLDDTHTADKIMHGIFRAEQVLKEQPTVDAVPVVRCSECVHFAEWTAYEKMRFGFRHDGMCKYWNCHSTYKNGFCYQGVRITDGFCADGKRRTE